MTGIDLFCSVPKIFLWLKASQLFQSIESNIAKINLAVKYGRTYWLFHLFPENYKIWHG